jgi:ribosomal protein L7Ae-like RNA K-turn-binding protein
MVQSVNIDSKTTALISFALKAGQVVKGFESVQKSIRNNSIAIILLDAGISRNTLNKMENSLKNSDIPVIKTMPNVDWKKLWGIEFHKILGILKGDFGKSLSTNIKAGV